MNESGRGRAGGAGGCPTIGAGIIYAAGVKIVDAISAPHDHFAGPHCCVLLSASGRVGGAGGCPTISARIVSPAGVQMARDPINKIIKIPAPDDHFASCPDCRVPLSAIGCIDGAGGCPTIGAGVVSSAGVQKKGGIEIVKSAPDDHFTSCPHCRVIVSGARRVGGAGSGPTVGGGIIPAASVKIATHASSAAPDNHFAAGPHCRVIVSAIGCAGGAGWSPCVVGASVRPTRYCGKRIVSARHVGYFSWHLRSQGLQ